MVIGSLLAIAAGGLDTYTYLTHGKVFASMQTGNLILLGIAISRGQLAKTISYLLPICAFWIGSLIARIMQYKPQLQKRITRQQLVLILEIIIMIIVGGISDYIPIIVSSSMLSFAAAFQLTEFNKLHGESFNSLMMSGNIKKTAVLLVDSKEKKDARIKRRGVRTLKVILSFILGVIINAILTNFWGMKTIFFDAFVLFIALLVITKEIKMEATN